MKAEDIAFLLPAAYRDALAEGSPLAALLAAMEALHAPVEVAVGRFPETLDPRRAPDPFVPMLGRWMGLGRYLEDDRGEERRAPIRPGPLRELVAGAGEAARLRGTRGALLSVLSRATGVEGFSVEENPPDAEGRPQPFHVRVRVPAAAAPQIDLVRRLVAGERPAWVTWETAVEAPPEMAAGPPP